MAEYWQDVRERAQATIAVWQQHFASLALGATNLAAFQALTTALPDLAQTRDDATQTLDEARQVRDFTAAKLRQVSMRVPKIIEDRLDLDADWSAVPYDASGNAIGPFEADQTVRVRTRVTNPSGSREGGTRQLTLLAQ